MKIQWFSWFNAALLGLITLFLLGTGFLWITGPGEVVCSDPEAKQCELPKGAFTLTADAYEAMNEPVILTLENGPPNIQLPDLRNVLLYYGKNGRPDAQAENTLLHFGFNGTKNNASISPSEKLYLIYDKTQHPPRYIFSTNNTPTSLWIESSSMGNEAQVKVTMVGENGEIISEPDAHANLKLTEKEFLRQGAAPWELDGVRVDGTLLARQKARWFGKDKFLELHGGDEFKDTLGKERIEFGDEDNLYSIYAGINDTMIWKESRWQAVAPGRESLNYPLLVVKKIDERIMALELWDVDGKGKVILNLLKSNEPWVAQNSQIIQNTFKFVGARTRSQYVFEVNNERLIISPQEWMIFTPKDGWKKLTKADEIDDYVNRKKTGALFVFNGLSKQNEQHTMLGTLFSPSRSEMKEVEISIQSANTRTPKEKDEDAQGDAPPAPNKKPEGKKGV